MTAASAVAELFGEGMLVLVGGEDDRTTFVAAAAAPIAPERLAQLQSLGQGTVVLGMSELVAARLRLPAPPPRTRPGAPLRLMAPVDAARSSGDGGWSLQDRALTMRVAADPESGSGALTVPGHVLAGQVSLAAHGAAAAALELAQLAGMEPVVALAPVLDELGRVVPLAEVMEDPRLTPLPFASSAELHDHALWRAARELAVTCEMPMRDGGFRAIGFGKGDDQRAPVAFVHGDPSTADDPFVHVHLACQLGDVFGSLLCDCRAELDAAIGRIVADGCGVIVYAQPARPSFVHCPRGQASVQPAVIGLLCAIGVRPPRALTQTTTSGPDGAGEMEAWR